VRHALNTDAAKPSSARGKASSYVHSKRLRPASAAW
jgi:hypothetical protein